VCSISNATLIQKKKRKGNATLYTLFTLADVVYFMWLTWEVT
jgi:hypothetical protein